MKDPGYFAPFVMRFHMPHVIVVRFRVVILIAETRDPPNFWTVCNPGRYGERCWSVRLIFFTQQKSSSLLKSNITVFRRKCTYWSKSVIVSYYSIHYILLFLTLLGRVPQIAWVPPRVHWDPVASCPGYRLLARGRLGHLSRSSGSSGPQRLSQVLEDLEWGYLSQMLMLHPNQIWPTRMCSCFTEFGDKEYKKKGLWFSQLVLPIQINRSQINTPVDCKILYYLMYVILFQ